MSWKDFGTIFPVKNLEHWAVSNFYVPTAIELEGIIRVYGGFLDEKNYSRLGYVDIDSKNPTKIIGYSKDPVLEDSSKGHFDCDGVTPLSVVQHGGEIRLYYAGWEKFDLPNKRYTLFTGLCLSDQQGLAFHRYSDKPIIGPRSEADQVRTVGRVNVENGLWRTWFASYEASYQINGKSTPCYSLNTMSSPDGIEWGPQQIVFPVKEGHILGYGRSAIWFDPNEGLYNGLFSLRSWDAKYYGIYHSKSKDSLTWDKLTLENMGFSPSQTIDGQTEVCFPSLIHQKDRILMFYNGDSFGKDGLRIAIWNKNS
jgi:hypothetical protein